MSSGKDLRCEDELIEKEVLSGLFNIDNAFAKAIDFSLSKDDFFRQDHKMLFDFMHSFYIKNNVLPDKQTIMENVSIADKDKKIEFGHYLERIISYSKVTLQRLMIKIDELRDLTLIRALVEVNSTALDMAMENKKGRGIVEMVVNELSTILYKNAPTDRMTLDEGFDRVLESVKKRQSGDEKMFYLTGFKDLDENGGIVNALTYIVGRPGSCKSLFALLLAFNQAVKFNVPSLLISSEMINEESMERLISSYTKIPGMRILKGELTDEEIVDIRKAKEDIGKKPLHFAFNSDFNIDELRSNIIWFHEAHGVEVVFLDYFQLFKGSKTSKAPDKQTEYSEISRAMMRLQKQLNIPIVCLAQASKRVDERKDNRIQLQDIRYTDQAAQDAGVVWALYNDEMYNKDKAEKKGTLEISSLKGRKTKVGWVAQLRYDDTTQSLMNYDFNDNYEEQDLKKVGLMVPDDNNKKGILCDFDEEEDTIDILDEEE